MSATDIGGQILTFNYFQQAESETFNRINHKVLSEGILEGGDIVRISNSSIEIEPFIAIIRDDVNETTIRLETTENALISINQAEPYIVVRFEWINSENNFADIIGIDEGSISNNDLILGKLIYDGVTLQSTFDYTRKTVHPFVSLFNNNKSFNVRASEPNDNTVYVEAGNIYINNSFVEFVGGTSPTLSVTSAGNGRTDLICIDDTGSIQIVEGTASASPVTPDFPEDYLTLAIVEIPVDPSGFSPLVIRGDWITNLDYSKYFRDNFSNDIGEISDYIDGNDGTESSPTTRLGELGKEHRDNGLYLGDTGILTKNHKSHTFTTSSGVSVNNTTFTDICVAEFPDGFTPIWKTDLLIVFNGRMFTATLSYNGNSVNAVPRISNLTSSVPESEDTEAKVSVLGDYSTPGTKGNKIIFSLRYAITASGTCNVYCTNSFGSINTGRGITAVEATTTDTGLLPDGSSGTKSTEYNFRDTVIHRAIIDRSERLTISQAERGTVNRSTSGEWATIGYIYPGYGNAAFIEAEIKYHILTVNYSGSFKISGRVDNNGSPENVFYAGTCEASAPQYVGRCRLLTPNDGNPHGMVLQIEIIGASTGTTDLIVQCIDVGVANDRLVLVEPFTDNSPSLPDGTGTFDSTPDFWRFGRGETEIWSGSQSLSTSSTDIFITRQETILPFSGYDPNMFDEYILELGDVVFSWPGIALPITPRSSKFISWDTSLGKHKIVSRRLYGDDSSTNILGLAELLVCILSNTASGLDVTARAFRQGSIADGSNSSIISSAISIRGLKY